MVLIDQPADEPGVCALVIGVGSYHPTISSKLNMGANLSSATASAIAFGDWVANRHNHPGRPLKYLDVVISEAADSAPGVLDRGRAVFQALNPLWEYEKATFDGIFDAMSRWSDRIDRNYEDIALFYFCGHGVEVEGVPALFPGDFDVLAKKWHELIAIDDFFNATAGLKAKNKYFFTDACRELPKDWREMSRLPATQVIPSKKNAVHSQDARHWVATRVLTQAFGAANQPSQFTSAMLAALDGLAAESVPVDGTGQYQWGVNSNRVKECALNFLKHQRTLDAANGVETPFQEPQDGSGSIALGTVFHVPGANAATVAKFSWVPSGATIGFHLSDDPAQPAYFTSQLGGQLVGAIPLPPAGPSSTAICTVRGTSQGVVKASKPTLIVVQPSILLHDFQLS